MNTYSNSASLIQSLENKQYSVNILPVFEQDQLVSIAYNYKTILDKPQSLDALFEEIAAHYTHTYKQKFTSLADGPNGGIALMASKNQYTISIFRNQSDSSITVLFKTQ